jgi:hypothetical protein
VVRRRPSSTFQSNQKRNEQRLAFQGEGCQVGRTQFGSLQSDAGARPGPGNGDGTRACHCDFLGGQERTSNLRVSHPMAELTPMASPMSSLHPTQEAESPSPSTPHFIKQILFPTPTIFVTLSHYLQASLCL